MTNNIHNLTRTDDVVIVGGGLAGLFCALKLAPRPVTLISAAPLGQGASSAWAQGGIAAAVAEGDTPEAHAADTVAVGGGLVDEAVALGIAREAIRRIHDLLSYGVPFDRDLEGKLAVGREAAHSARRIVHVRGDGAGAAIIAALSEAVRRTPSIRVIEGLVAEALLTGDGAVAGLQLRDAGNPAARPLLLAARAVMLATGGIGHLYAVTTNPLEASGSGLAIAARAGAVIADPEFVQFHPTAIMTGGDPAPLATEALRGEGATLVNGNGERFMAARHPLAELAPRDIVARGVFAEIAAGRGAFLDARAALGARFADRFPTVHASCIAAGIDPARQAIPIAPAAHYHMGGIAVDARGRSSIDGLWAGGEVSSTGAHGANRLASNSLLEAVVYAARIADDIAGHVLPSPARLPDAPIASGGGTPDAATVKRLRAMMSAHVGVIRDDHGLMEAVHHFATLEREATSIALRNMATSALLVAASAWSRRESRGAHFRIDHPTDVPALAQRTMTTLAAAREVAESLNARPLPRSAQPPDRLKEAPMTPTSLLYPDAFISPLAIDAAVQRALDEDLGRAGDITSLATIPEATSARAVLVARQSGVIAGLPLALATLQKLSADIEVRAHVRDAARVARGQQVLTISGPARAILTAERCALNFVGRLSGVATLTADYVARTEGTKMRICCTRKTTPGLRALEKYAVRCGGGFNHRFGLDDAILIKDNHIAVAGGIRPVLERARAHAGHLVKVEIEVDTLSQLREVLDTGLADAVLLDNMDLATLREAVRLNEGRLKLEASGGVTLDSIAAIAATGVDYASAGALTHSAPNFDCALDIEA